MSEDHCMTMPSLKVLHGLFEVAGQNYYSVKGLRELGVDARTVITKPNNVYPYDFALTNRTAPIHPALLDYAIDHVQRGLVAKKALGYFDLFHFHFGQDFLFNRDLCYLDKKDKPYYFEYHGSDLRRIDLDSGNAVRPGIRGSFRRSQAVEACRKAKGIILHDDELMGYLPTGHASVHIVPLRVNIEELSSGQDMRERETITVVHAPSNRGKKGTEYVLGAFETLKSRYKNVRTVLVEGKSRNEALQIYKEADIIVDQLLIGTYGVLSIEAMALGKPVVAYISKEMSHQLPPELPIVNADRDSIEPVLCALVEDMDARRSLGQQGREYAGRYHDYKIIARYLLEVYTNGIEPLRGRDAFAHVKELRENA